VGWNTHVHGSNARNVFVELSLPQVSKNTVSFLLSFMFSLQQNRRTRVVEQVLPRREGEEEVAQIMYTHVSKSKNDKIKLRKKEGGQSSRKFINSVEY
jgi:hypothetical protein